MSYEIDAIGCPTAKTKGLYQHLRRCFSSYGLARKKVWSPERAEYIVSGNFEEKFGEAEASYEAALWNSITRVKAGVRRGVYAWETRMEDRL